MIIENRNKLSALCYKYNLKILKINIKKCIFQPGSKLVANSKAVVPTVGDNAVALQLSNSSKNAQNALNELRIAAEKVSVLIITSA